MKTRLHSKRYLKQILSITIMVLLTLCALFILALYISAYNSSTQSIAHTESSRTDSLHTQANIHFEQLIALGSSLASLNIPSEELDISHNIWARTIFNTMLASHTYVSTYIDNIDIMLEGISFSPTKIQHQKSIGKFYFFDTYTENKSTWPFYFDLKFSPKTSKNSITLTVSAHYLSNQLFTSDDDERCEYLLTQDGTVLLTNQKEDFFANIQDLYPGIELSSAGTPTKKISTYNKYYYTLSAVDKYDFQVLSLIPREVYSHQYTTIFLQTLLMSCMLLLIALSISIFLAARFYRPISSMIELMRTYIQEDIHDYENEIAYISQNISKYIAKGKEAETLLPQTMEQLHNAQTAVLQHQINSHFLFNTLENIKMISVMELGIDNEIENSIILLNTIIHEGILQKKSITTLSHELHLARCYLELMQLRFPSINIRWSVDETLLQCNVFKFSLQPILENCFAHAFKGETGREKFLDICIYQQDKNLLISIKDNGHGMDADSLDYLEHLLSLETEPDSSRHVGVYNVHKRITNVFGENYGIQLINTAPGITVNILYPMTTSAIKES